MKVMKSNVARLLPMACLFLGLLSLQAQTYPYPYPRTRSANSRTGGATATNQGLTATFHGTLKSLSKKEIVITNSDDQDVVIRISKKTKYWKNDKQIKPNTIQNGILVSVDAGEDIDMKPIASAVRVETLEKKQPGEAK